MTTVQPKTLTKTNRRLPRTNSTCTQCSRASHSYEQCPAKTAICHCCNEMGLCRSRCFTKQVPEVSRSEDVIDTTLLDTISSKRSSTWFATIQLNNHHITFKLDTRAEVTAISEETYQLLQKPKLKVSTNYSTDQHSYMYHSRHQDSSEDHSQVHIITTADICCGRVKEKSPGLISYHCTECSSSSLCCWFKGFKGWWENYKAAQNW